METLYIKNDDNILIGSNIKRLRTQRGMKATELIRQVNLLGVDLNTFSLSKIEANTQHIKASQFKAIMQVLECSAGELLKESN
ncbi:MAG: helix-turn-helix transcriptional regulator [Oscillospiraceae bacterium]|nr:helix-turn-helix transcriptional regulator [Oscillospiraceae bacterium]